MRLRELQVRFGLFAASLLAMLWGYQLMLLDHLPDVFADPKEDMSYGWYIPLFSLYVLWTERTKIREAVECDDSTTRSILGVVMGLVVLLFSTFVGFLGIRGLQVRLEIVGFVGMLYGLVWTFYGLRTVRQVLFPVGFLLFCIPLHTYLDLVTIHLRMLAVTISTGLLRGCGVEIVREGTMLAAPTGAFSIDVAEPCSGMRSLFAMMALTAGYAYFTQPTWFRRGLLFVLSIPIAIFGNVMRILTIAAVASACSADFAMGFYHDYSGYVVFLTAVLLMVAAGGLITKGASKCANS